MAVLKVSGDMAAIKKDKLVVKGWKNSPNGKMPIELQKEIGKDIAAVAGHYSKPNYRKAEPEKRLNETQTAAVIEDMMAIAGWKRQVSRASSNQEDAAKVSGWEFTKERAPKANFGSLLPGEISRN